MHLFTSDLQRHHAILSTPVEKWYPYIVAMVTSSEKNVMAIAMSSLIWYTIEG
jgi:hypothetical protein